MIAGMTITDARKETFDFSEPYYTANSILAVQESSKIDSMMTLKERQSVLKTELPHKLPWRKPKEIWLQDQNVLWRSSMYDSLNLVLLWRSWMTNLLSNTLLNKDVNSKHLSKVLQVVNQHLPLKGENPELIEMFNNGLANLKKSGQYQKILDKYLNQIANQVLQVQQQMKQRSGAYFKTTTNNC